MVTLKDMPAGTIWPHVLDAIALNAMDEIQRYAASRVNNVARGAETPELAALMVEKYGEGMVRALNIAGIDSQLQSAIDRLVRSLDPDFEAHRHARWAAHPASLSIEA